METLLWDRDEVIFQIRRREEKKADNSYSGVLEDFPRLLFAGVHYFKNWGKAVTAAGINYTKIRRVEIWSKERIIKELRTLKRRKESLRYIECERNHLKILGAASYHFGSWRNALKSIGVDYRSLQRFARWNRKGVKREIRRLYRKEMDISYSGLKKARKIALVSAGSYYFGNWGKAVIASNLPYQEIRRKRVGCFAGTTPPLDNPVRNCTHFVSSANGRESVVASPALFTGLAHLTTSGGVEYQLRKQQVFLTEG